MIHCYSESSSADPAFVGVVDGRSVRVTPFGQMVVPPPMSAFELRLPSDVKQVIKCVHIWYNLTDWSAISLEATTEDQSSVEYATFKMF